MKPQPLSSALQVAEEGVRPAEGRDWVASR
jgi:hypothetical protein